MRANRRRVVITGLGPISTFGIGIEPLWEGMIAGRNGVRLIENFDASGFACPLGAALEDSAFDVRKLVPKTYRKATKVMARDIALAVGAADAAVRDAGLMTRATDPDGTPTIEPARSGCHIGAGLIAADVNELSLALASSTDEAGEFDIGIWGESGMSNLTPLWLLKYLPNMLACHVTIIHDCQGPSNTITCAEASSGLSLGESIRVIARGHADMCLSGGAESKLNPMGLLRQQFAGRIATLGDGDDHEHVVRPFSEDAAGSVLGEGGGILVLEALESALERGVRPSAEVVGFGASQAMCPDTVGLVYDAEDTSVEAAMRGALASSKCSPEEIDAVLPLGSGIRAMDEVDKRSIQAIFGARAGELPLITLVPNVGLCGAGSGAIAAALAVRCLQEQVLPARLGPEGMQTPGLDAAPVESRSAELRNILVFTTSMGGQNIALVLRRYDGEEGDR